MAFVEQFSFDARSRQKGATLVELIVVTAALGLLATILIPALSKARRQAWRMECAGNLRALGNAYNFYKTELGRYPDVGDRDPNGIFGSSWRPGDPKPTLRIAGLDNIGSDLAEAIVYHSLGDPRALYCPTSLRTDRHAPKPYAKVSFSGRIVDQWRTGQISYFSLVGVTDSYFGTFDPAKESPNRNLNWKPMNHANARAVLLGDRTVELAPRMRNIPGSNHGREGGWFYFTSGDAQWRSWNTLTAHPSNKYIWYWPSMVTQTQTY